MGWVVSEKLIRSVSVSRDRAIDVDRRTSHTGMVHMYGFAQWLKNEPMISAKLAPTEARRLAKHLLIVADEVDAQ